MGVGGPLNSVFTRGEETHREAAMLTRRRDWSDRAESRGTVLQPPSKAGGAKDRFSPGDFREAGPANTSLERLSLCFKLHNWWDSL